jgi:hypothetical protein
VLVKRDAPSGEAPDRVRRDPEGLVERLCAPMRSRLAST